MSTETAPDDTRANEPVRDRPTRHRPRLRRAVTALLLAAVVGFAYAYFVHRDHAPAPQQAAFAAGPLSVTTLTMAPRDLPLESRFLAQSEASQAVEIRARVAGYLVARHFEEGQEVEEGQDLFRIDPAPFEVALKQAEAGMLAAKAQLQRARQQVKRFEGLAELQQAAANELEQAQEQQRVAEAQVAIQDALVERARLDLGYATIKSPIRGTIGLRQQDLGSFVGGAGGNTLLATVRKVKPMSVRFSVSEKDLLRWQRMTEAGLVRDVPVDELTVRVILGDGRELPDTGRIDYVDVAVDPSTGTAVVRATVPNPRGTLLPGQFVTVRVGGVSRLGALVVPRTSVIQSPVGASLYLVGDDGTAQLTPIRLGEWTDDGWIIDDGLKAGDRVILDHLMQLRPGIPVEPTPASVE